MCNKVTRYLTGYKNRKYNLHKLLIGIKCKEEEICRTIKVNYKRNNKEYKKLYMYL